MNPIERSSFPKEENLFSDEKFKKDKKPDYLWPIIGTAVLESFPAYTTSLFRTRVQRSKISGTPKQPISWQIAVRNYPFFATCSVPNFFAMIYGQRAINEFLTASFRTETDHVSQTKVIKVISAVGGAAISTLWNGAELSLFKLQESKVDSLFKAAKMIYLQEGARGLMRGAEWYFARNCTFNLVKEIQPDVDRFLQSMVSADQKYKAHYASFLVVGTIASLASHCFDIANAFSKTAKEGRYRTRGEIISGTLNLDKRTLWAGGGWRTLRVVIATWLAIHMNPSSSQQGGRQ